MVSGQIVNFYMDNTLNEVSIYINGNRVAIKKVSSSALRISGNASSIINTDNLIHDDNFGGGLRYQVVYKGNNETFYISDNLWSIGKYEKEPEEPEEETVSAETSSSWRFFKPYT